MAGLTVTAIAIGVAMDTVEHRARSQAERERRQTVMSVLAPHLPASDEPGRTTVIKTISAPESLGPRPVTVLLSTTRGEPAGVVFWLRDVRGYAGPVGLILAVEPSGRIAGVEITSHNETPGFGDVVDGTWTDRLRGASLIKPAPSQWKLRSQGGYFDGVSGATITLSGILEGVRSALEYHQQNREYLYDG